MNSVLEKRVELRPDELDQEEVKQFSLHQPGLYEVYLHNDDFTPMEFVIEALRTHFHMDDIKAKSVTLEAHTKGRAVCGVYCRDVAETRIDQAAEYARTHDHPLKWSMEAT
jgi:ATP-dependent Clp protease adaptor protein ClpS